VELTQTIIIITKNGKIDKCRKTFVHSTCFLCTSKNTNFFLRNYYVYYYNILKRVNGNTSAYSLKHNYVC